MSPRYNVCILSSLIRLLVEHSPFLFFFFNDTATTEIYTLSLHDALPISNDKPLSGEVLLGRCVQGAFAPSIDFSASVIGDRKSTRLNSSHSQISYAVFCLKKKNN